MIFLTIDLSSVSLPTPPPAPPHLNGTVIFLRLPDPQILGVSVREVAGRPGDNGDVRHLAIQPDGQRNRAHEQTKDQNNLCHHKMQENLESSFNNACKF